MPLFIAYNLVLQAEFKNYLSDGKHDLLYDNYLPKYFEK